MTLAFVLVIAMVLDAAFGEPDWLWSRLPHPAVVIGRAIGWMDSRFNRGRARKLKGALVLAGLVAAGLVFGWLLSLSGPVVEAVCAAILLAQRSLADHVAAVATGLRHSLSEGRAAVAMIVSRDTSAMNDAEVARAAIESAAENLSDGVIAPAFWFLLGGLPAMIAYKCINTADSMIGYRTPQYEAFGWAAARSDDLANLIPARLTALLLALCGRCADATGIWRDARLHRSPNAGWPEAAMARSLGIALAGPRTYDGARRDFPWVNGSARRELNPVDIDASIVMLWKAWGVMLLLTALIGYLTL